MNKFKIARNSVGGFVMGSVLIGSSLAGCASKASPDASSTVSPSIFTRGPGELRTDAIVLGPGGTITIVSPFVPPYNIVDNHCHNAASQNCSTTDGYIACMSQSSSTWTSGHTINWAPDPSKPGDATAFCAYEPQAVNGSTTSGDVCCWSGTSAGGTPNLSDPAAQPCVTTLCLGQAVYGGVITTPPTALPVGETPPVAQVCNATTTTRESCASCCDSQAATQAGNFPKYGGQAGDYDLRCRQSCASLPITDPTNLDTPGSNDGKPVAQGRICSANTSTWSTSSYLTQCLACCATAGYGSPAGSGGTTGCEAVCNAQYK